MNNEPKQTVATMLNAIHPLRDAGDAARVSYHMWGVNDDVADTHCNHAVRYLKEAAKAMGYTLTPIEGAGE